jgi:putative aldouronate transport system permease protein
MPRAMSGLGEPMGRSTKKAIVWNAKTASLLLLFAPALVLLVLFNYIPIGGIVIAFKNFSPFRGILKSPWVGVHHFAAFLGDAKFWSVVRNTVLISFLDIVFGFPAPIVFALLANEIASSAFKRTMQTISYLPHFLSWVVVFLVFYQFLSPMAGLLNKLLVSIFHIEPVPFLIDKRYFLPVIVFVEIWKSVGWGAILYFATIAGIDSSLYEAAHIDGAGRWRMAWHVTLPSLLSIIVLMFILRISGIFQVGFERIFMFATPLTYDISDVISVYVYRLGLVEAQYSLTTAIGLVQSVLGFTMLFAANRLSGRVVGLGLW